MHMQPHDIAACVMHMPLCIHWLRASASGISFEGDKPTLCFSQYMSMTLSVMVEAMPRAPSEMDSSPDSSTTLPCPLTSLTLTTMEVKVSARYLPASGGPLYVTLAVGRGALLLIVSCYR